MGARSLNIELQAALNPAGDRKVERFGWTFAPGDKVMQIENDPIPFTERKLSLTEIASRWKRPVSHVRIILLRGGVPLVDVERPPTEGAYLKDLEAFERKARHGEEE